MGDRHFIHKNRSSLDKFNNVIKLSKTISNSKVVEVSEDILTDDSSSVEVSSLAEDILHLVQNSNVTELKEICK